MKHSLFFTFLFLLPITYSFAQGVGINEDGNEADPSAILDVSATDKGVLIPRLTQQQRDAIPNPATGLMIYQSDQLAGFYFWDGSKWNKVGQSVPKSSIVMSKTPNNTEIINGGFSYIGKASLNFSAVTGTETFAADTWQGITLVGAPSPRESYSSVWTGSEFIVWGGTSENGFFNNGARYDPKCNSWMPMSNSPLSGRRSAKAVWTGSVVIIFGGSDENSPLDDGAIYDPSTDTWTLMNTINAPKTALHSLVWTGTELIVWGGVEGSISDPSNYVNSGARYNLSTDTWTPISTVNAPSVRYNASSIWTGTELITWGGYGPVPLFKRLGDGARYNPSTDTWTTISSSNAPIARAEFVEAWTGTEIIIWGGNNSTSSILSDGFLYNPTTDTWRAMTTSNNPSARVLASYTWTGDKLIIWGGYNSFRSNLTNTGGIYDPTLNSWTAITTTNAPSQRVSTHIAWAENMLLIWGGRLNGASGSLTNDGNRYTPEEITIDKFENSSTLPFFLYEKQ